MHAWYTFSQIQLSILNVAAIIQDYRINAEVD
jgi:hypothetical protein